MYLLRGLRSADLIGRFATGASGRLHVIAVAEGGASHTRDPLARTLQGVD